MPQIKDIVSQLESKGFARVEEKINFRQYIDLCKQLGAVMQIAVLRIVENGDYAVLPKPVVFHTDNPQIQTMGWFCADQDDEGGANELIDLYDLNSLLSDDEKIALGNTLVDAPNIQTKGETVDQVPVLSYNEQGKQRVYYTPWLLQRQYQPHQTQALNKLSRIVAQKQSENLIQERLLPGQCLFIDNRRMLHGRKTLNLGSKRCLLRCWINSNIEQGFPSGVNLKNFPHDNPLCQGFDKTWFPSRKN